MLTKWNNPDKTELNNCIKKVGEIYEKYKFTRADRDTLFRIRKEIAVGLMEAHHLLEMYLDTKGMAIDKNTKEIIKQN